MARGPLEADTCRDYVLPALDRAHWTEDQIREQVPITDGRIVVSGKRHRRDRPLRADYVLDLKPAFPLAVVEAKRLYKLPSDGLQQATRYTGKQTNLAGFPDPTDLWRRYRA